MPFIQYETSEEKHSTFNQLINSVQHCNLCGRMCNRKKVLSRLNGNLDSKVIFIAEAPGRLGADCTGIPLYGDKTGDNFELLLSNIGWNRDEVFITNSILCNPQDEAGNNSTPTKEEIINCSYYLQMTLNLINPDVIVTLGVKALESLKIIHPHSYKLNENVGKSLVWSKWHLVPLYHMGPRAIIHRSMIKQRGDFIGLSHIVDPIQGLKRISPRTFPATSNPPVSNDQMAFLMLKYIISKADKISMFMVTKLMYLADYRSLVQFGSTISNSIYLRMQEGPWIPTLKTMAQQLDQKFYIMTFEKRKPYFYCIKQQAADTLAIDQGKMNLLDEIITKYKNFSDAAIKIATYRTEPMQYILSQEKAGRSMIKIPVIYKNRTVIDIDKELQQ